ncbi:MAG: glycosyltransferase, partial [Candidatus Levyibacteriota bacterium]
MWNSSLELDKYQYVRTNPYTVRFIGLLGIAATLFMGFGFWKYIRIDSIYLLVFGPIVSIFLANKLLRFILQLFYPKFDIKKHETFIKTFWSEHTEPSVDVFLPWAGEDLNIHAEVVKAVLNLDYKNYKVYMLDDVGDEKHKKLAKKYGFNYLSRPNKGEFKKSGNLQYGYDHTDGEFILILDADVIPIKETLRELIPYIVSDKEIGILQTPQYFEQTKDIHNRSKIE